MTESVYAIRRERYSNKLAVSRRAWSLAEIARMTGLSLSFVRAEEKKGALKSRQFGRRVLVLEEDLARYLSGKEGANEK